jgi:hypothetical protein
MSGQVVDGEGEDPTDVAPEVRPSMYWHCSLTYCRDAGPDRSCAGCMRDAGLRTRMMRDTRYRMQDGAAVGFVRFPTCFHLFPLVSTCFHLFPLLSAVLENIFSGDARRAGSRSKVDPVRTTDIGPRHWTSGCMSGRAADPDRSCTGFMRSVESPGVQSCWIQLVSTA